MDSYRECFTLPVSASGPGLFRLDRCSSSSSISRGMNLFDNILHGKKPKFNRIKSKVGLASFLIMPAGGEDPEFESSGL